MNYASCSAAFRFEIEPHKSNFPSNRIMIFQLNCTSNTPAYTNAFGGDSTQGRSHSAACLNLIVNIKHQMVMSIHTTDYSNLCRHRAPSFTRDDVAASPFSRSPIQFHFHFLFYFISTHIVWRTRFTHTVCGPLRLQHS